MVVLEDPWFSRNWTSRVRLIQVRRTNPGLRAALDKRGRAETLDVCFGSLSDGGKRLENATERWNIARATVEYRKVVGTVRDGR